MQSNNTQHLNTADCSASTHNGTVGHGNTSYRSISNLQFHYDLVLLCVTGFGPRVPLNLLSILAL